MYGELAWATLPLRIDSVANLREHWRKRAARTTEQRSFTRATLIPALNYSQLNAAEPMTVTMTRIAPRELDDDNLAAALKAVRDGVADALGLASDRDPLVKWEYKQERGAPKTYGVRVEVRQR